MDRNELTESPPGVLDAAQRPLAGRAVPRRLVLLVALGVVLLYAAQVNGRWRPAYDSAHYLTLGRSIAAGEGYRFNGHTDNIFPPGMGLLLAGVYRTVGHSYVAFHALMALSGLGALAMVYVCLKRLTDPATALLVAALTAVSYRFYTAAGRILSDVPAMLLLWLAIYLCIRFLRGRAAWLTLAPLISAATVLFRAAGVLMMGALGVGLLLDRPLGGWRRRLTAAVAVVVPAVATMLLLYVLAHRIVDAPHRYESQLQDAVQSDLGPVAGYLRELVLMVRALPDVLGNVMTGQKFWIYGAALMPLLAVGMAANAARGRWLAPAMCLLYPMGLALAVVVDIAAQPRMWMPIQPLLLLLAVQGLTALCVLGARWRRRDPRWAVRRLAPAAIAVLAVATAGVSLPRLARDAFINVYYARSDRFYTKMKMPQVGAFLPVAATAARLDRPDAPILVKGIHEVTQMHYLSGRLVMYWPSVDEADAAAVESARTVHRHARDNPQATTFLAPLRHRMPPALAREVRKVFDADPAWQAVIANDYYVLYHRVGPGQGPADGD